MSIAEEKVDGPQIAADILAKMEPERRGRLLLRMAHKSPELTKEVTQRLAAAADRPDRLVTSSLALLPPNELEQGLQNVSETEIAVALRGESEQLRNHLFQHLPPRRQQLVLEQLKYLPILEPETTQLAQRKILSVSRGKVVAVG
jgi:flagellar motor switch protein FliG